MKVAAIVVLALALPAASQHVTDPRASVVDVQSRQAALKASSDPVLLAAINALGSRVATPLVAAPAGHMFIPKHYLSGSNGPVNPAEAAATAPTPPSKPASLPA
jgi:poly(beta-D-mannuronate) lyase